MWHFDLLRKDTAKAVAPTLVPEYGLNMLMFGFMVMSPQMAWPPGFGAAGGGWDVLMTVGLGSYLAFLGLVWGSVIVGTFAREERESDWAFKGWTWFWGLFVPLVMMGVAAMAGATGSGVMDAEEWMWAVTRWVLALLAGAAWAGVAGSKVPSVPSPADGAQPHLEPRRQAFEVKPWVASMVATGAWASMMWIWEGIEIVDLVGGLALIVGAGGMVVAASRLRGATGTRKGTLIKVMWMSSVAALLGGGTVYPTAWSGWPGAQGMGLPLSFTVWVSAAAFFAIVAAVLGLLEGSVPEGGKGYRNWINRAATMAGICLLVAIWGLNAGRAESLEANASWLGNDAAQELVSSKVKMWSSLSQKDREELAMGERIYMKECYQCHREDYVLVGPPLNEIATIYAGNPDGIAAWAKHPGKKRPTFPQMPIIKISEENLKAAGKYMLVVGGQ